MKHRKEEKCFTFQEKLFPLEHCTKSCAYVFLGGRLETHANDCKDHSQGEQILIQWTHPEPHISYRKNKITLILTNPN